MAYPTSSPTEQRNSMRIIRLREAATCADCGAYLAAGVSARYYGKDRIYCEVHDPDADPGGANRRSRNPSPHEPPGPQASQPPGGKGARVPEEAERASIPWDRDDVERIYIIIDEVRSILERLEDKLGKG